MAPNTDAPKSTLRVEIAPSTLLLVLGAVAAVWLLGQLLMVLEIVIIALVIVGTFDPLVRALEHHGLRRGRALVLVFSSVALALVGVVILTVPPLLQQLADVVAEAPRWRTEAVEWASQYSWGRPVTEALDSLSLDGIGKELGPQVLTTSTVMLQIVGYGVSTLFLAIYLLAEPDRSRGLLFSLVPREHHMKLTRIVAGLEQIVGGYMRGQLITSASITVFVFVLAKIMGSENALALALFAGLTDILPFIGGYVASAPVVIAAHPHGTTGMVVVLVLMILYQEFESRFLVPRVYGRELRLPSAVVVVALLCGGALAGIFGALLALPVAAGLRLVIRELQVELPGVDETGAVPPPSPEPPDPPPAPSVAP